MRGWVLACLLSGLVAACQTPVPATGTQGAFSWIPEFSWGRNQAPKGSPDSMIWGGGAGCGQGYPASDLFEQFHEECLALVAVDGARSPVGTDMPPALVPPGPHRLTFGGLGRPYEFDVEINPSRSYRPHAEEEDGKLYVWLTEHPLPMPAFDDGIVFHGEPPPEAD